MHSSFVSLKQYQILQQREEKLLNQETIAVCRSHLIQIINNSIWSCRPSTRLRNPKLPNFNLVNLILSSWLDSSKHSSISDLNSVPCSLNPPAVPKQHQVHWVHRANAHAQAAATVHQFASPNLGHNRINRIKSLRKCHWPHMRACRPVSSFWW